MYDAADPRAALPTSTDPVTNGEIRGPQFHEFTPANADRVCDNGSRSWIVRTQHLVLTYTDAQVGTLFSVGGETDDWMIYSPENGASIDIAAGDWTARIHPGLLGIVPAGAHGAKVVQSGVIVRVTLVRDSSVLDQSRNAANYERPDRLVAHLPEPRGERDPGLRIFDLDAVDEDPRRLGRIYRSTSAMLNVFYPADGPRDPSKLSPHFHDDFEQLSLQLAGDYIHHLRTPWGTDLAHWRDDVHMLCHSPAVSIFPPPLIHTSQAVGSGAHALADLFSPPREDFAEQPGWVLNASDYAPS